MNNKLKQNIVNYINSDEMLPVFYYHFDSLGKDNGKSNQLLFFIEVKALRLWATLGVGIHYIRDRDEFVELVDFVKKDLINNTNDKILDYILDRHIAYNRHGSTAEAINRVGMEFVKNANLPHLHEEAVHMIKAFIGKASLIYREYY